MPKVSVIVPIYNAEQYIAETLRSVLNQTYQDYEIIIVDDGSLDRSIEICQQFSDPRIAIVRQANRGLPGARNTGIRHAQGDYIALLDADDLWLPEKLVHHVKHLDTSPTVGISFSYSAFIDDLGQSTGLYQIPRKITEITPVYVLCRNPIGNGSAAVIRRETFNAIKFQDDVQGEDCYFDERFRQAEDLECWLRIVLKTNWKIEGVPEILTLYRISSSGLSANVRTQLTALEAVIEKTRTYAPEVIRECESAARAYHLRYTARRAVNLRDRDLAVEMVNRALQSDWRILIEEPRRSFVTLGAAYLLWLLPRSLYSQLEQWFLKIVMLRQKQQISMLETSV